MNLVREPDAGNPPVRFDEREVETEHGRRLLCHKRGNPETEVIRSLPHRATSRLYPELTRTKGGEGRRSRTIPFDGDLPAALEEIQRVWPQLHGNPIQVVRPPSEISVQGRSSRSSKNPGTKIQPAAGPKDVPPNQLPRNDVVPPAAGDLRSADVRGQETLAQRAETPAQRAPGKVETGGWRAASPKGRPAEASKPILLVPGEGTVTITSDDPAALARFEELLRALSRQKGTVGRNFSVFLLRNGKAASVAQTLQQVLRNMPTGWRGTTSSAILVPDERLNAIVAYGNRAERTTIENLVKVLDTSEVPESMTADRLHLIPVKNTSAARIEEIMRTLFHSQVDGFGVEETTNSLVVMASEPLAEEIGRVVKSLDEAAGSDPSRTVTIVPLRKASSERVQKALDIILKTRGSR